MVVCVARLASAAFDTHSVGDVPRDHKRINAGVGNQVSDSRVRVIILANVTHKAQSVRVSRSCGIIQGVAIIRNATQVQERFSYRRLPGCSRTHTLHSSLVTQPNQLGKNTMEMANTC